MMKVLWITSTPFPETYKITKENAPVTTGWVHSSAKALLETKNDIQFAVASFYNGTDLTSHNSGKITYYLIPIQAKTNVTNLSHNLYWKKIKKDFKPDIIHLHGTEYPYTFSFVESCGPENVVISIQGLVSVYDRYYYGHIDQLELFKSISLRDLIRRNTVFSEKRNMQMRGHFEKTVIKNVNHFIGRTSWDKNHIWAINPSAHYHFCNETLRPSFYNHKWSIQKCQKNSIFLSQAHYPIKGFHQLIKALPIVLRFFPDVKVYVAGHDFFSKPHYRLNGYGRYIKKLIKYFNLSNHITFTGLLSEAAMCQRYLDSHVFICPSVIENSPNSLGEAQILGVPCIASVVGGVANMVTHEKNGLLYRFEEVEMLAKNICRIFSNDVFAQELSVQAREVATVRHNKLHNTNQLYSIYSEILSI